MNQLVMEPESEIPLLEMAPVNGPLHKTGDEEGDRLEEFLGMVLEPGTVVELRAIKSRSLSRPNELFRAEQVKEMGQFVRSHDGLCKGIYFTLNPLHPPVLCRGTGKSARSEDVLRRRLLLIDADPKKPEGIPAESCTTEAEKVCAWETIQRVRDYLQDRGWPEPILCDSGNGFHLLYRVNLPADDGALVKRVLHGLGRLFDSDRVLIDKKVFDAPRICKLPFTWVCKGANTPERPYRQARVLDIPPELLPVSQGQLEAIASLAPSSAQDRMKEGPAPIYPAPRESVDPITQEGSGLWYVPWDLLPRAVKAARKYLKERPGAIQGFHGKNQPNGGDPYTFDTILILCNGYALPWEAALPVLQEWNQKCKPEWKEDELKRKWFDYAVPSALSKLERRGNKLPWGMPEEIKKRLITPAGPLPLHCLVQTGVKIGRVDLSSPLPETGLACKGYSTYSHWINGTLAGTIAVV
jgi:hypothetical protein